MAQVFEIGPVTKADAFEKQASDLPYLKLVNC